MARGNVVEIVTNIAYPIVTALGYELVDVEYVKEGSNMYLRVFIDKPGGITIDDCQAVSEKLSKKIDEADPISQSYYFEVSSPGLGRPLKNERDFERYIGETVKVKLYKPVNDSKEFDGILEGLVDGNVCITDNKGEKLCFNMDLVAVVRRAVKLDFTGKDQ